MMMIRMHSYRYLPFKTSQLLWPKSMAQSRNSGASAVCPVTQRIVWLCNGPSGYVSRQGLGIRAEHMHMNELIPSQSSLCIDLCHLIWMAMLGVCVCTDERVTLDLGRTLQQARMAKTWTQKDLATVSTDLFSEPLFSKKTHFSIVS